MRLAVASVGGESPYPNLLSLGFPVVHPLDQLEVDCYSYGRSSTGASGIDKVRLAGCLFY
jgi:hypothetical protein